MTSITPLSIFFLTVLFFSCGQTNSTSSNYLTTSSKTLRIKTGRTPGSVEIADFNNDKIPDLAVSNESDSNVTILLGKGKGEFTEAKGSPFFAGHSPNDVAIGD